METIVGVKIRKVDKALLKRRVKKSLDTYDESAVVQEKICVNLNELLRARGVRRFERVFEIGCGTGLMSAKLLQNFDIGEIIFNDIVPEAESYLQKHTTTNWQFLEGDIEQVEFPRNLDLVVSTSALHWVSDIEKVFRKAKDALKSGGLFAFATYGPDNFLEVQTVTGHGLSYRTKEELIAKLGEDFEIIEACEERIAHEFQHPLDVLKHMKLTGVNSTAMPRWTKGAIDQFCNQYTDKFAKTGSVPLTYHPIYFVLKSK